MSNEKGCGDLTDASPYLAPGWGCCQCKVYNNILRERCKRCGHEVCGKAKEKILQFGGLRE